MRVGIDARHYGPAGRGQQRYIRCLIHALARTGREHEFLLLGQRNSGFPSDLGSHVRFVPARRRLRLQYRPGLVGVRRMLLGDVDLVHFPLADGWYARVRRSVVTIHDLSMLRFPEAYCPDATAERRAWNHHRRITANADKVLADSRATGRDVVTLLEIPEERVEVVPLGVEPRFARVTDPARIQDLRGRYPLPRRYLLFVGGVDFKKNVTRLVEGYALARRAERLAPDLVVAGPLQDPGNPFFDQAQERAAALGVAERIRWIGYVLDSDLPALYSSADAFVFPSIMEGFGLPVLEAMACGVPVVTSAGSAMAEVTGEEAATLVDPLDPESISQGILQAMDEAPLLASAGIGRAAGYTWERTAERTIGVYERVISDRYLAEVRT